MKLKKLLIAIFIAVGIVSCEDAYRIDPADEIIDLYQKHGGDEYFGESVTQLQHAFQSAELAIAQNCDDEMVLAAFLHDIGHICVAQQEAETMANYGVLNYRNIQRCLKV